MEAFLILYLIVPLIVIFGPKKKDANTAELGFIGILIVIVLWLPILLVQWAKQLRQ